MDASSSPALSRRTGWRHVAARSLRILATITGIALVIGLLFEAILRAFPALIPPDALRLFHADVRTRIAARRGLISALNIEYVARTDGGPPHRLWRYRPGAVQGKTRFDGMGFCNLPADVYAREAAIPLITLGDSFTFCWRVDADSAWPARLGSALGVAKYNLGLPDMGMHEEVQLLERFGLSKRPVVVVLAFYEGNDLRDAAKVQAYRSAIGADAARDGRAGAVRASLPRRIFYGLMNSPPARWSYAFNLGLAGLGLVVQRLTEKRAEAGANFRYRLVLDGQTIPMNSDNSDADELEWARALDAGRIRLDVFSDALRRFAALGDSAGFAPVVAYLPSAHTVYRAAVVFDDPANRPLLDAMHEQQVAWLRRMADSLHFRLVDLTAPLRAAVPAQPRGELLFYPNDLHMTPRAHAVVAAHLAAEIAPQVNVPVVRRSR